MKHEDPEIVAMLTEMGLHGVDGNGGTDKGTEHKYTAAYATLLAKYRDRPINFLEIGVFHGGSAALWCKYLPKAKFLFMDIVNNIQQRALQFIDNERASFLFADAYKVGSAAKAYELMPDGLDFAIDDGPHSLESMCYFLKLYGPIMRKGGTMVIEDIQTPAWFETLESCIPPGATTERWDVSRETGRHDDIMLFVHL